MSKAAIGEIAAGVGLVALDLFAPEIGLTLSSTFASLLVGAGSSLILGGIGTLLSSPLTGISSATRNPTQPWNVIYGRAKMGGTIVYIEETGDSDKYLHMVLVLACHPCQSVDALLFDNQRVSLDGNGNSYSPSQQTINITSISRANEVVTVNLASALNVLDGDIVQIQNVSDHSFNGQYQISFLSSSSFTYICGGNQTTSSGGSVKTMLPNYNNLVHMETLLGNHTSTFPGLLSSSNGLWTNQHLLLGRTAVYLRLQFDQNIFANGLPTISFLVHGKNDIYDPRTASNGYTENAALCTADYLAQPVWGFKANYGTELPAAALISAANVCDEAVPLANGGSEPRYAVNGSFSVSLKRGEVLQNLLTACGGRLTYSAGQFEIQPAAWAGPSLTIGDDVAVTSVPMLMNSQGLVVNAYNNQAGRGAYFDQAAGTSEGQALMIKGLLDAYNATGNPQALSLAKLALSPVLHVLYRGASIPSQIRSQTTATFPTLLMNGWSSHVADFEGGTNQGHAWINNSASAYTNPQYATDGDPTTACSQLGEHTHTYYGCIWSFPAGLSLQGATLNILSEVPSQVGAGNPATGRSAGIWYSLDGGTTWTNIYNSATRAKQWDSVQLAAAQDSSKIQVMAFLDSHDDMGHYVYEINLNLPPAQFAPHWLFCVKNPFRSAKINYGQQFTFTNGVVTIPDPPDGALRYVYQVISPGATLLWNNPYSALTSGTSYSFTYSSASNSTTITLSGTGAGFNGPLVVIYSNQSTASPMIKVGDPFEAWPDERALAPGEIDAAMDTFNWFYRAFSSAGSTIGGAWSNAAAATLQQAAIAMAVNDNRDWLKLTFTGDPFSEGSRFKYVDPGRLPTPVFGCDADNYVFISAKAGSGEIQYGNAGISDFYNSGDSTQITVGSTTDQTLVVFIDPAQTYVAANRYSATLNLTANSIETFTLTASSFTNPAGQSIPAGTSVYTVGFSDTNTAAHILTIGRVRQLPNRPVRYNPGVVPYTCNLLGSPNPQLVDWRGDAYMGYQQPWFWKQVGNETAVANTVQLLHDAQAAWTTQTGQTGVTGPFAPVFHLDRQDASSDGGVNTFSWTGDGDPHSSWGGYQYRPLAELAELVKACIGSESYYSQAVSIVDSFLTYIDGQWSNTNAGPPTEYPPGASQATYPEPHFVALILRAVLLMDQAKRPNGNSSGSMQTDYQSLLNKAMAFWTNWYQSTGTMAGTFCTDVASQSWFGFWHGELLRTLSSLMAWASAANINQPSLAAQASVWITGLLGFAAANVVDSQSGSSALILSNASSGFQWRPKLSMRDLYNGVKGKYVCPSNNWQQSDFPPYCQDSKHGYTNGPASASYDLNLYQDGGDRRWLDIQLPFTISSPAAQRLAKIELMRRRYQGAGTFGFNMWGYQMTALDVIEFTLPLMKWQDKLLEVSAHRFLLNKQNVNGVDVTALGTEIDLVETDPGVYAWSTSEELTPQGYQQANLPARNDIATQIDYSAITNAPGITVNGA